MFSHVMVGSNDLERSKSFYDRLFEKPGRADQKSDAGSDRTGSTGSAAKTDTTTFKVSPAARRARRPVRSPAQRAALTQPAAYRPSRRPSG